METIRLIGYNPCSVTDGSGLREVAYIAFCTHACPQCQNQKYWQDKGDEYRIDDLVDKLYLNPLTDITISGGDGLTVQYENTLELCRKLKQRGTKNIWLYTGYTYEELIKLKKTSVLAYIDVLVDGKFYIEKKDVSLKFRGSSNQRIIDVSKSLEKGEVVLY